MFGSKGTVGPTRSDAAGSAESSPDCLVVGPGVKFGGVIATCEHLIVRGTVVSDTDACQKLDVSPGGSFRGTAKTDDADIAGVFEGQLTVHGCLRIRATGCVRGHISYGSLAIESGGRLLGKVEISADGIAEPPRADVLPLRNDGFANPGAA